MKVSLRFSYSEACQRKLLIAGRSPTKCREFVVEHGQPGYERIAARASELDGGWVWNLVISQEGSVWHEALPSVRFLLSHDDQVIEMRAGTPLDPACLPVLLEVIEKIESAVALANASVKARFEALPPEVQLCAMVDRSCTSVQLTAPLHGSIICSRIVLLDSRYEAALAQRIGTTVCCCVTRAYAAYDWRKVEPEIALAALQTGDCSKLPIVDSFAPYSYSHRLLTPEGLVQHLRDIQKDEQQEQEKAAAEQQRAREIDAWVGQHGSPLLKRRFAEGHRAASLALYRRERLELEYPEAIIRHDCRQEDYQEAEKPTMDAYKMLDEIRAQEGLCDVTLKWLILNSDDSVVWQGYVVLASAAWLKAKLCFGYPDSFLHLLEPWQIPGTEEKS